MYYMGGMVFSSAVAFAMLPYYTRVFTPPEFGVLSLYVIFQNLLSSGMSLSLDAAWNRFSFDYKEEELRAFYSSLLSFLLIWGCFWIVILLQLSTWATRHISGGHHRWLYAVVVLSSFFKFIQDLLTFYLQINDRPKTYLVITVASAVASAGLSILFISGLHLGIVGRVLPTLLIAILLAISLLVHLWMKGLFHFSINHSLVKKSILYSLPTVITVSMGWVIQYVDRVFIKAYYSNADVGIYSAGYQTAYGIMSLMTEAVSAASFAPIMRMLTDHYWTGIKRSLDIMLMQFLFLATAAAILSIGAKPLIAVLFHKDFQSASGIMPWVFFAFVFAGMNKFPMILLSYHRKIWAISALSSASAAINIGLNFLLIPRHGGKGAAVATLLTFLINTLCFGFFAWRAAHERLRMDNAAQEALNVTIALEPGEVQG